jgi:hypothetical protein
MIDYGQVRCFYEDAFYGNRDRIAQLFAASLEPFANYLNRSREAKVKHRPTGDLIWAPDETQCTMLHGPEGTS